MLKNNFRLAFRNLKRNSTYTAINILGLSLGISISIIIFLTVQHEFSYDEFHSKKDKVYRVVVDQQDPTGTIYSANVPYPLAVSLKNAMPNIPAITGMHFSTEEQIEINGEKFNEPNIIFADSGFFDVFDFPVIVGNPKKALSQPNQALVTEDFAAKYFEDGEAIGKYFKLNAVADIQVSGIIKNTPSNSHLSYNLIISYSSFTREVANFEPNNWGLISYGYCYLTLPNGYEVKDMNDRLQVLVNRFQSKDAASKRKFRLQPLNEIHFDERYANGQFKTGNKGHLLIWICIGIFILAIASINFINLSTALSVKRSKEVGVRKVLGADKQQLVKQFLGETFLITLVSVLLSLGLVEWISKVFNNYFNVYLELDLLGKPSQLVLLVTILLSITLLSGLYPSFVLSNFKPVEVLSSKLPKLAVSSISLRHGLVVLQFIIAQILIIGTIVISLQLNYFNDKPLGFSSSALINLPLPRQNTTLLEQLKGRLLAHKNIENVSFAIGLPTSKINASTGFKLSAKSGEIKGSIDLKVADKDYLKTFGLEMKAGSWFQDQKQTASSKKFVINETAAKLMGFSNPEDALGKYLDLGVNDIRAPIIGVIKDFHMTSLREKINPMVIFSMPQFYQEAGVKVNSANLPETIEFLREQWENTFPDYVFKYSFLDTYLQSLYQEEQKTLSLFKLFSGLSIFIGCLGLFGLISFTVYQRTKEIGVRKVLGASIGQLLYLLSREFLLLVSVAFVIASPLAWYLTEKWLANFAFKTTISWWYYFVAFGLTLFIALVTMSIRSFKAATMNPVISLRDD